MHHIKLQLYMFASFAHHCDYCQNLDRGKCSFKKQPHKKKHLLVLLSHLWPLTPDPHNSIHTSDWTHNIQVLSCLNMEDFCHLSHQGIFVFNHKNTVVLLIHTTAHPTVNKSHSGIFSISPAFVLTILTYKIIIINWCMSLIIIYINNLIFGSISQSSL